MYIFIHHWEDNKLGLDPKPVLKAHPDQVPKIHGTRRDFVSKTEGLARDQAMLPRSCLSPVRPEFKKLQLCELIYTVELICVVSC